MFEGIQNSCSTIIAVLKDFCYDLFSFFFTTYEFDLLVDSELITYEYNGLEIVFVFFASTIFIRLVYGVIKSVLALK